MPDPDIRWIQLFDHFETALSALREAVELARTRPLSKLEEQGLIQAFEFTHELAWKTLKDFLEERGAGPLYGSKDVTRLAFRHGLVADGQAWMDMIRDRNLTTHTYNAETAAKISAAILGVYFKEYEALRATLGSMKEES